MKPDLIPKLHKIECLIEKTSGSRLVNTALTGILFTNNSYICLMNIRIIVEYLYAIFCIFKE